jgi:hypothetical protein
LFCLLIDLYVSVEEHAIFDGCHAYHLLDAALEGTDVLQTALLGNGSNAVLREEQTGNGQDPPREYIVNYIYDDHWNETGSGTVSGSGTIPLPEPDLAALAAPQAAKTLTENLKDPDDPDSWDGTYTMTLSVTVPGQGAQNKNRANIVVVYDSSNSMFEPDYYYEDPNGSYGTLYG